MGGNTVVSTLTLMLPGTPVSVLVLDLGLWWAAGYLLIGRYFDRRFPRPAGNLARLV